MQAYEGTQPVVGEVILKTGDDKTLTVVNALEAQPPFEPDTV